MYTESPPLAGRAASDRPYRPGPRTFSPVLTKTRLPNNGPSAITQTFRALGRFCVVLFIGIGAALVWQSYGGELVRAWAPSLGWLFPPSPSAELQAQLKPVAIDLAIMKRSVEQLASNQDQLARKQDQMTQTFATLQAAVRDINQNILALAPLAPKGGSKLAQPAAQ